MSSETKIFGGIMAATLILIVGVAVLLGNKSGSTTPTQSVDPSALVNAESQVLGPADAKVTVVEFSDFECPACKSAEPTVEEILKKYGDKIRFVYRNFPLTQIHQDAMPAAQAAEAAGLQGKFWEMHNLLFEKSPALSHDELFSYAQSLELDMTKFTADFDSDAVRQIILNDVSDGNKVGIRATPTFFINGTKFEGALSPDQFSREIDLRLN